jgi:hypothetical protein
MTTTPVEPAPQPAPQPTQTPPGSPPTPGEMVNVGTGKTYTEEQVNAKMRGQGTRIKELEDQLAASRGEEDTLRKQRDAETQAELERLRAENKALSTAAKERTKARQAKLKSRLEAIPEDRRPDVLRFIDSDSGDLLDAADVAIGAVEKLTRPASVYGGATLGTLPMPTQQAQAEEFERKNYEKLFGKGGAQ